MNRSSFRQLSQHGNKRISSIVIRRAPLSRFITLLLRIATRDKLRQILKDNSYDNLYHLSLIIEFENDETVCVLEKNERVSLYSIKVPNAAGAEYFNLEFSNKNATIKGVLMKMEEMFGKYLVYNYSAKDRNCQDFVIAFIRMLNVHNFDAASQFIKQDVSEIFDKSNVLRKITNTITDTYRNITSIFNASTHDKEPPILGSTRGILTKDEKIKRVNSGQPFFVDGTTPDMFPDAELRKLIPFSSVHAAKGVFQGKAFDDRGERKVNKLDDIYAHDGTRYIILDHSDRTEQSRKTRFDFYNTAKDGVSSVTFEASSGMPGSIMQISNKDVNAILKSINFYLNRNNPFVDSETGRVIDTNFSTEEYKQLDKIVIHRLASSTDYNPQRIDALELKAAISNLVREAAASLRNKENYAIEIAENFEARGTPLTRKYASVISDTINNVDRNVISLSKAARSFENFVASTSIERAILRSIESEHTHLITPRLFKFLEVLVRELREGINGQGAYISDIADRRITLIHGS